MTGKERKVRFKTFHKLLGLVTYLDWCMIIITTLTTISMMFETPQYRVMDNFTLQIMDYAFVFAMGGEIWMKILVSCLNSYIIKDDKSTSIELDLRPPSDKSITFLKVCIWQTKENYSSMYKVHIRRFREKKA